MDPGEKQVQREKERQRERGSREGEGGIEGGGACACGEGKVFVGPNATENLN